MHLWEQFEVYLDHLLARDQKTFTSANVREDLGVDGPGASALLQSYLDAQRRFRSETRHVLHRTGRTSAAVWTIGVLSKDGRQVTGQFMGDFRYRLNEAVSPDLRRITELNPRAGRLAQRAIDIMASQIETMVALLVASNAIEEEPPEEPA